MNGLQRVFIAINVPEAVKERIFSELSALIPAKGCKKVEKANLHITMRFLGYLNEEKIMETKKALEKISLKKFEAELCGVNHFNGRVIWLGVAKGSQEFNELSGQLSELAELPDERFHAHLTLARNKSLERNEVKEIAERMNEKNFSEKIAVESTDLMESVLSHEGPVYKKLFEKKLQ
ncbi:MAG: RNA 2',3'-cyclic phosphodiesterase [Candidatus Diapherotrites archaeon]